MSKHARFSTDETPCLYCHRVSVDKDYSEKGEPKQIRDDGAHCLISLHSKVMSCRSIVPVPVYIRYNRLHLIG